MTVIFLLLNFIEIYSFVKHVEDMNIVGFTYRLVSAAVQGLKTREDSKGLGP